MHLRALSTWPRVAVCGPGPGGPASLWPLLSLMKKLEASFAFAESLPNAPLGTEAQRTQMKAVKECTSFWGGVVSNKCLEGRCLPSLSVGSCKLKPRDLAPWILTGMTVIISTKTAEDKRW